LVTAHDERPRIAVRARHLRVDEHVLDLPPPTCESVAGPPSTHSKPLELRADSPLAPANLACQLDRAALEPEPLMLAHGLEPTAAARRHARRRTAGDEPVEDRLDLVRRGVSGCAQPSAADRAPLLTKSRLGEAPAVELHHLRPEHLGAEAGVLVRVRPTELVV